MNSEYKIVWSAGARENLLEIGKYIAKDSVNIALKKLDLIEEKVNNLGYFANEGRNIPELMEYENNNYKEVIVFPWRIIYKIEDKKSSSLDCSWLLPCYYEYL